jgi:hypothetical protein
MAPGSASWNKTTLYYKYSANLRLICCVQYNTHSYCIKFIEKYYENYL